MSDLEPAERLLLRKISHFPVIVSRAQGELAPQQICTYLYELSQEFNRFYEANRVVGDQREAPRAKLVECFIATMRNGLKILNIPDVEVM